MKQRRSFSVNASAYLIVAVRIKWCIMTLGKKRKKGSESWWAQVRAEGCLPCRVSRLRRERRWETAKEFRLRTRWDYIGPWDYGTWDVHARDQWKWEPAGNASISRWQPGPDGLRPPSLCLEVTDGSESQIQSWRNREGMKKKSPKLAVEILLDKH